MAEPTRTGGSPKAKGDDEGRAFEINDSSPESTDPSDDEGRPGTYQGRAFRINDDTRDDTDADDQPDTPTP